MVLHQEQTQPGRAQPHSTDHWDWHRSTLTGWGKGAGNGGKSLARGINVKTTSMSFHLSVGELQKVKLEEKFLIVTGCPGLSTSTWHSWMLLQVLAAVIPRYKNPSGGCGDTGNTHPSNTTLVALPRSSQKQNVKTFPCRIRVEQLCIKTY